MAVPKMIRYSVTPSENKLVNCAAQSEVDWIVRRGIARTGVDDVHRAHGTAGIVEHPLLLEVQVVGANLLLQLSDNEVHDGVGILAMSLDGALGELVQILRVENVELVQTRVEEAVDGGEKRQEDSQQAEAPEGEQAARGLAGRLASGGLGRHCEG